MEIDTSVLREHLGPGGPWATEAGLKVQERRKVLGLTEERLAVDVGVTRTTIRQIEAGQTVPRDYLRAAIAWALARDVADFWPPLRRERIQMIAEIESVA